MTDRTRYLTKAYSSSRDKCRAEHAAQDITDARDYVARFNTANNTPTR